MHYKSEELHVSNLPDPINQMSNSITEKREYFLNVWENNYNEKIKIRLGTIQLHFIRNKFHPLQN